MAVSDLTFPWRASSAGTFKVIGTIQGSGGFIIATKWKEIRGRKMAEVSFGHCFMAGPA